LGGRKIHERVLLYTNDHAQPRIELSISGHVEHFARIRPPIIRLSGAPGAPVQAEAAIVPNERFPFKITGVEANDKQSLSVKVIEPAGADYPYYRLLVTNQRRLAGRFFDVIILQTDSPTRPLLQVGVASDFKNEAEKKLQGDAP